METSVVKGNLHVFFVTLFQKSTILIDFGSKKWHSCQHFLNISQRIHGD